jgi:hypothetical protein
MDASRFETPDLLKRVSVNFKTHESAYDTTEQKWFKDSAAKWNYLTPEGGVYDEKGVLLGGVDVSRFETPHAA